jgi:hypothetical protein
MGTQRGQMKGVLSWLVRWAFRAGTIDFCSALAALNNWPSTKILFPHRTLFQFLRPHQTAMVGRLIQLRHGVAQPMLHKMSIQRHKVSSFPFPVPSLYSPFSYMMFWKLADRSKCAQPIGEIFPTPPLYLYSGGG